MSNTKSSSKFLLLSYQYSYAMELEQSCYVTFLAYATLCLMFHTPYMSKNRAMLRWWFVAPLGGPKSYACRSIGSESQGDLGSFLVHGRGARVHGKWWMHCRTTRLRGRRQVETTLSVPCNLPWSGMV
jgi:hypothetical protein